MKKLLVMVVALAVVFSLSTGVLAFDEEEGNLDDSDVVKEVGVDIDVAPYALVQVDEDGLDLDIDDPSVDEQSVDIDIDVHSNAEVNTEFKSIGMELPEDLDGLIESNDEMSGFHPAEYFEYSVSASHGGWRGQFHPDVEKSDLEYIEEGDKNHSFGRWWFGSDNYTLSLEYTHNEDIEQQYMEFDDYEGWEGLMAGEYSDTIQITVSYD